MRESIFRRTITRFVTVDVKETPCTEQATTYVVVVRVNGSHLIKNYLITFLALIRYAWFSLSRAPRLPRHAATSFSPALCPSRSYSLTLLSLSPFNCLFHHLLHSHSSLHIPFTSTQQNLCLG